jgi:hypothetical protein
MVRIEGRDDDGEGSGNGGRSTPQIWEDGERPEESKSWRPLEPHSELILHYIRPYHGPHMSYRSNY